MTEKAMPNGPAAAALLAGGIGATVLGINTILVEASAAFKTAITFYKPVGPLSGKTGIAVVVWLVAWGILGAMWKDKDVNFERISMLALILLGLGVLFTFPPFFFLFAAE